MLFADYGFEGGYGVLVKFLENFICIFIFFVLLEGLLYFKDYNELMIIDNYLRYEIKNKELMSFSNERYEVIINDNEYKPINHAIISKSNRYKISIKTNNGLINDDIRLVVKDVLNNQYCYKIEVFETLKNGRKTKNILSIEEEKEED